MEKNSITISTIEHLAELSGLEFTEEEKKVMQTQVIDILDMFNGCAEADTIVSDSVSVTLDHIRNDEVMPSLIREDLLSNSPNCMQGYIVTSKVVD